MVDVDVAVVGAGAAGLSLAHRLARIGAGRAPTVALLEPPEGPIRPPVRTWCFWEPERGEWDEVVTARWRRLSVIEPDGTRHRAPTAPLVYKMIRSPDHERLVRSGLGERVRQISATVERVEDGRDRAAVHARDPGGRALSLTARWVFDSRPPTPLPRGTTTLLQHFRGWFVRTADDAFTPGEADLMDLRTPQPRNGVSFGYVLPLSRREALVEYTEFTREVLDDAGYRSALRHYTGTVLRLGDFTVTAAEQGAIPMTDARFPTRAGLRVFRIGTAGGATRPATGYTFSGVQRQGAAVARALAEGRTPVPPTPHRRRHLAMDAVLLRALDTGRIDGAAFFARLFRRNALPDVLGFLDGTSGPVGELLIGTSTPVGPMSLTAAERLWHGLRGGAGNRCR
ncbi:lycopene beta-cyclase [Spinactinospora alkalitolerans]|uniref:Lycopene beta-cyclase n=1 Tax=Spinactinospora alkalitolerans TaxID=687207 RepID=A0A852TWN6_9ACTN|nr:lycopene cyclase family protein [Spinactinospora alkalitolerans]NYE47253.1 lycopene beta-cyclase [Spinactinospora alkalitolerans]